MSLMYNRVVAVVVVVVVALYATAQVSHCEAII